MQATAVKGSQLSIQQSRLWSLQQESQIYHTQMTILLEGKVDRNSLFKALQRIIARHEILHTIFPSIPGMEMPIQVVAADSTLHCSEIILEGFSVLEQDAQIEAHVQMAQETVFDAKQGPLLRCCLLILSPQKAVLLCYLSALCADAATLPHLVDQLRMEYEACLSVQDVSLPPQQDDTDELLQYADVAAWQHDLLVGDEACEAQNTWSKYLSQMKQMHFPLELSIVREAHRKFSPQIFAVPIEAGLWERVNVLARQLAVSQEAVILACWQVMLARYLVEPEILLGIVCNGRHYEELETAYGLYARTVPLEFSFAKDQTIEQLLPQVSTALEKVIEQQEYFSWDTVSEGKGKESPFFLLSFEWERWSATKEAGEVRFSLRQRSCCTEPFLLKLVVLQIEEKLCLELHYDAHSFSSTAVQQFVRAFSTLLKHALNSPQLSVGHLELLDSNEQQRLLQACKYPMIAMPQVPLHALFEAQVVRTPQQIAVVYGEQRLSYAQLNCRSNQLAHWLRRQNVGSNIAVGLCLERSVDMLIGLLGILKAGGAYVPLDPMSPDARLAYQVQDVEASLILTEQSLLARLPAWSGHYVCMDMQEALFTHEVTSNPEWNNVAEDHAYVIYTSGSTGVPKGVLIRHRSVVNYSMSICSMLKAEPGWNYATVSTLAAVSRQYRNLWCTDFRGMFTYTSL